MSSDDVTFNCYFNGKFRNNRGNIVTYIGGEVHTLECNPQALFSNLMSSLDLCLYGQRIWYKMPYESNSELKLMCNSEADFNFQRMCTASLWTKVVDIFLEKDDAHENDGGGADATASRGGVHDNYGDEVVEEEARVEAKLALLMNRSIAILRLLLLTRMMRKYKVRGGMRGSKKAVESLVGARRNVKYTRWGSEISEVRCSTGGGCPFRIYCAYDERPDMFIIKFFEDKHTCNRDEFCKILTEGVIARLFLNDIRNDPDLKPKYMQDQLQQHYDLGVSHDQCKKAKKKAFKLLEEEFDEQFSRLQDYRLEILDSNPYSTCELQTVNGTGTMERFDRFYVCFHNIRTIWRHFCRPIIGIDGFFLKNNVKGKLLVAVGRDANNQFYPMAWAVVQVENTKTWLWFIEKLKMDLELKDGDGFTLISDRQKGLINAVDQLLPKVEHRMCARHVYGNLARVFPGRSQMKKFFGLWQ